MKVLFKERVRFDSGPTSVIYQAGRVYELPGVLAQRFIADGRCENVETEMPQDALSRSETSETPEGRVSAGLDASLASESDRRVPRHDPSPGEIDDKIRETIAEAEQEKKTAE